MSISSILISWYLEKKRDLPWRNTSDPYKIWVSEIILQQTRVAQGISYYYQFLEQFPDIKTLANADIADILKVWQGLGYYSRARNLHAGAKYIMEHFHGVLPENYNDLIKIKGIGEYTASAIGSFAFNLPLAVVDGNVNRFIARFYGIHEAINSSNGIKQIKQLAEKILDRTNPAEHNQAIMEFGALQCVIRKPECNLCPFFNECHARFNNKVDLLPIKLKLQGVRNRYFNYFVIVYQNYLYINRRSKSDIWQGLYDFPLLETEQPASEEDLKLMVSEKILSGKEHQILDFSPVFIHQLSHQKIHARFILLKTEEKASFSDTNTTLIEQKDFHKYPIPKLIDNYISTHNILNYLVRRI